MELISIIPDFQPRNDPRLLTKAEALKPVLQYTEVPAPVSCRVNGEQMTPESLKERPLRAGAAEITNFGPDDQPWLAKLRALLAEGGAEDDLERLDALEAELAEIRARNCQPAEGLAFA